MTGIWRGAPGQLLGLYIILDVAAVTYVAVSNLPPVQGAEPLSLPVAAFLAWRVSRGGRVSRVILLVLTTLSFGAAAFMPARSWSPPVLGLLALYGAQLVLLISPAVYQRTRREAVPGQVPAAPARWRPPLWLPLSALLAGVVVTLLYLGSMRYGPVPGCGPAGATTAELPSRCFALAEGYPVRFLSAYLGTPEISKTGLAADWAQWSLVGFTVLYLSWLLHHRPELQPDPSLAAEEPPEA